jgi:N-acyl-D-amino-acid deacylase
MRAKIRAEALKPSGDWEAMADLCGPEGVMPVGFTKAENQPYVGKRLSEIAEMRGQAWIDAAMDLLISEEQRISTIYFMMDEENIKLQLQQPWVMVGTDAGGLDPAWAAPLGPYHPRAYGSYARILGKYVREEHVLPLEDAIRKMSWAVASRLGLHERGRLHVGCYADVVIFDPTTVGDRATFEQPHQLSVGVRDVWVNGTQVLANGSHTGTTPGRIVEGPGRNTTG